MKNKKNLIGIAVIGVLIAGGIFAFWHKNPLQETNNATPEQKITAAKENEITEPDSSPIDLSDEAIADWETCRNEEYGYEFKYPRGWYVYENISGGETPSSVGIDLCKGAFITLSKYPTVREGWIPPTINAFILDSYWTGSLEKYLQTLDTKLYPVAVTKKHIINGVEVIQYIKQYSLQALMLHRGNVLNLRVDVRNHTNQTTFLGAILSTFKFIE